MLLPKPTSRKPLVGIALGASLLLIGLGLWLNFRPPPPPIPVPDDLAKLEPQLRDYVLQQLSVIRRDPRRAEGFATLGVIYAVNGLWPEARETFQTAAHLDPSDPLSEMYVGVAAQEMNEFDVAIEFFRRVTGRFPRFAPGFYRLGYALLRTAKYEEAEAAFARLTELAPAEWRGYAGLAEIRIRSGKHAEAIPLLEKALKLEFEAKTIHHLLGQAYRAVGRNEEAELELLLGRNAVDSPMPDAWSKTGLQHIRILQGQVDLANDYASSGEPAKAVRVLSHALAYHPNDLNVINQCAIALNRAGQPHQAIELLKRAMQKDPNYVPILITLSFAHQMLAETNEALAAAERAIKLAPNLSQGHVARANALLGMERDEEALAALETAARVDPQNAEIIVEMGDILWRNLNRPDEAKARYEIARHLDPALVATYVRLADLELQLNNLAPARAALLKLRRLAPNSPELPVLERRLSNAEGKSR